MVIQLIQSSIDKEDSNSWDKVDDNRLTTEEGSKALEIYIERKLPNKSKMLKLILKSVLVKNSGLGLFHTALRFAEQGDAAFAAEILILKRLRCIPAKKD